MNKSYPFGSTYKMLSKSMDISSRRHNLITGNIANMDTINYKPKDLDFQKTLKKAMQKAPQPDMATTHPKHYDGVKPYHLSMAGTKIDASDEYHLDSVDIDTEMSNLVENNIKYRTAAEMLLRKIAILNHTITEGGR